MKNKTNTDLAFKLLTDIAIVSKKSAKVRQNEMSEVFASTVDYNCYKKKKRGGVGFRNIAEPPENLKVAQATILNKFLYQLWFRKIYLERFYYYDVKLNCYIKKSTKSDLWRDFYEQMDSVEYFFNLFDRRITGLLPRCSYVNHPFTHVVNSPLTNFATTIDFKDAFPSIKKEHVIQSLEQVFIKEVEYYAKAYVSRLQFSALKKEHDLYQRTFNDLAKKDRLYQELLMWCDTYVKVWRHRRTDSFLIDDWLTKGGHLYWKYVDKDDVANILNQFDCYREYLREKAAKRLGKTTSYFDEVLVKLASKISRYVYPMRHPLFGGRRGKYKTVWFRQMIRDEVKTGKLNCPKSKAIVKILAKQMAELLTYNGELPQGVPTSGLILCLIVSQQGVVQKLFDSVPKRIPKTISIYSDDIVICTGNRPNEELKKHWSEVVESTGIFKMNYKKFRTIDRRQRAPAICGLKLIRKIVEGEEITFCLSVKGAERAQKLGKKFITSSVAIAKKKQKQIRAMFHKGSFADVSDPIHAKLSGYVGYIHQVYGHKWPNQLLIPYKKYRQRFKPPEPKLSQ